MAKSPWFPEPTGPATHLLRRPGEPFQQMQERTGGAVSLLEQVIRYMGAEKRKEGLTRKETE